jgi:hypothetical protein
MILNRYITNGARVDLVVVSGELTAFAFGEEQVESKPPFIEAGLSDP